jgi:hypothetical protein
VIRCQYDNTLYGGTELHPTFEKFLEPIRDKNLSVAQRRFYLAREIEITKQTNAVLEKAGDTIGRKFGEEYLTALKELAAKEGLPIV